MGSLDNFKEFQVMALTSSQLEKDTCCSHSFWHRVEQSSILVKVWATEKTQPLPSSKELIHWGEKFSVLGNRQIGAVLQFYKWTCDPVSITYLSFFNAILSNKNAEVQLFTLPAFLFPLWHEHFNEKCTPLSPPTESFIHKNMNAFNVYASTCGNYRYGQDRVLHWGLVYFLHSSVPSLQSKVLMQKHDEI